MLDKIVLNGINTKQLTDTVTAIKSDPTIANFEFRLKNKWVDGGENKSLIQGFYGAGQEDTSRTQPFVFVNGEPPVLLGTNQGANPVEFLLHALAGCVTTTLVLHAAARGIQIEKISTSLEGDINLLGLLDLDRSVTPGYSEIRFKIDAKADCSDAELDDLIAFAAAHSPVCQTIERPVPIVVERAAAASA